MKITVTLRHKGVVIEEKQCTLTEAIKVAREFLRKDALVALYTERGSVWLSKTEA